MEVPLPEVTADSKPFWDGLAEGELRYQRCGCGRAWLPARTECPGCLSAEGLSWAASTGRGVVYSWVVYHRAFHPAFEDRVPYNVALIELEEGPRLISNVLVADTSLLAVGMPVTFEPVKASGIVLTRFVPVRST